MPRDPSSLSPAGNIAMSYLALTRPVSASIGDCELTHLGREPIDVERARGQHGVYVEALRTWGLDVIELPALDAHPDAVFVEDDCVVVDEVAVITRPGAESRRGEVESVAAALASHRELVHMADPATLDGGDVARVGRTFFVGRSTRTNEAGVVALRAALSPFGYEVVAVDVPGALHLKSAVSALDDETVLVHRPFVDIEPFITRGLRPVDVPDGEAGGANVLVHGGGAMVGAAHPRTAEIVANHGLHVTVVDHGELLKAEAGLTCCSVILRGAGGVG